MNRTSNRAATLIPPDSDYHFAASDQPSYFRVIKALNLQQQKIEDILLKYGTDATNTIITTPDLRMEKPLTMPRSSRIRSVAESKKHQSNHYEYNNRAEINMDRPPVSRKRHNKSLEKDKAKAPILGFQMYYEQAGSFKLPSVTKPQQKSLSISYPEDPTTRDRKDQTKKYNTSRRIQRAYGRKSGTVQKSFRSQNRSVTLERPPEQAEPAILLVPKVEQDPVNNEESDSDKEEPLALQQYYKTMRDIINRQTLEEINFLYFSKNEAMKDWTDKVMLMFERHDKELQLLRKKTKYLQKFDEHYFTSDAFFD